MTSSHPLPAPCQWFSRLASALDRRSAPRLALLFLGAVLARGRRTVTSWIRAAGLSDQFRPCYTAVAAAGKKAETHRRVPRAGGGQAAAGRGRAVDARPGRHADPAVRAARPGGRRPPQPDPRPGRVAVRLRPRLRRPRAAGHPPGVGRDRPAAAGPAVRPQEGPARHRPEAPAGVPDQAGAGRRAAAVGQAVAGAAGQAAVGGGRRGLRQGGLPQAGEGAGDDGRQPAAQGRGPVDACPGRSPPGRRGPGRPRIYGDRPDRAWPSGPASGAGGRPRRSTCTGSG